MPLLGPVNTVFANWKRITCEITEDPTEYACKVDYDVSVEGVLVADYMLFTLKDTDALADKLDAATAAMISAHTEV